MHYVADFDGLHRTKYEFSSNEGQKLAGYMYSSAENQRAYMPPRSISRYSVPGF